MNSRNQEIYRRHGAGEKAKNLAAEYGISTERIRQICKSCEITENCAGKDNNLYRLMQYRYAFQISSGRMSCAPRFAYRYVAHRWRSEKHEGEPTIEYFLSIPEDEIRNAKNIGRQTMEYMLRVQRAVQTERQSAQT